MVFADSMPDNIRIGQTYYISLQLGQPKDISAGADRRILPGDRRTMDLRSRSLGIICQQEKYNSLEERIRNIMKCLKDLHPGEKVIVSGYETFGKNEKLVFKKSN